MVHTVLQHSVATSRTFAAPPHVCADLVWFAAHCGCQTTKTWRDVTFTLCLLAYASAESLNQPLRNCFQQIVGDRRKGSKARHSLTVLFSPHRVRSYISPSRIDERLLGPCRTMCHPLNGSASTERRSIPASPYSQPMFVTTWFLLCIFHAESD